MPNAWIDGSGVLCKVAVVKISSGAANPGNGNWVDEAGDLQFVARMQIGAGLTLTQHGDGVFELAIAGSGSGSGV